MLATSVLMISMSSNPIRYRGFTVVELVVVIAVIGILAGIIYVSYSNTQEEARIARIKAEANTMKEAIETARVRNQTSLRHITGSYWTGQYCLFQPPGAPNPGAPIPNGTDFSVQNTMTQGCWDAYLDAVEAISDASGIDVTDFRDPWGRPYYIDENEQDSGTYACSSDALGWLSYPYVGGYNQNWPLDLNIPAYKASCYT